MNEDLKNTITRHLNQVEALKFCTIIIENNILSFDKINNFPCVFSILKNLGLGVEFIIEEALEKERPIASQFLMQTNFKTSDIKQLDLAIQQIEKLAWQSGSFKYIRDEDL